MATAIEVPKGKNIIHTLDNSGDTRLMWSSDNEDEIKAARDLFRSLKAKQYTAYRAEGKEGKKGEVITEFDPEAERIIMVPRQVGG